jgi:hypothetical protein
MSTKKEILTGKPVPDGAFTCDCRLTAFLHVLMRDHVPFGVVEDIVKNHLKGESGSVYEHETTGKHANFMAKRIIGNA